MNQALYRKYRPKSLDEVIGQEAITKTLSNAITTGKISHAYLFTGPRGVGKTTVARILAHEVNQLPYKDESIHLDIIEIDGASNRRIEEVRDLREKVHIAPTSAKYKVYIIDEVHMLTREAFNALLKTLEEPPSHCIFILATTEVHKLPETIISRAQHFTFKPISNENTVEHLKSLSKKEKLDIEPEALRLLAEFGDGSFRDSINLLDQLSSSKKTITQEDVSELAGLPANSLILELLSAADHGQAQQSLEILLELQNQGIAAQSVAAALGKELRFKILTSAAGSGTWISTLLKNLLEVSTSKQPQDVLEIVILEAATRAGSNPPNIVATVHKDKTQQQIEIPRPEVIEETAADVTTKIELKTSANPGTFDLSNWDELLKLVKHRAGSLYTALRLAKPVFEGGELNLLFEFGLHHKKVSESKNIELIEHVIKELSGSEIVIKCVLNKTIKKPTVVESTDEDSTIDLVQNESLQTISNIFGQTEMLES